MPFVMLGLLSRALTLGAHSVIIGNGRVRHVWLSVLIYSATAYDAAHALFSTVSICTTHLIVLSVVVNLSHFNSGLHWRGRATRTRRSSTSHHALLRISALLAHFQNQ